MRFPMWYCDNPNIEFYRVVVGVSYNFVIDIPLPFYMSNLLYVTFVVTQFSVELAAVTAISVAIFTF